MKIIRNLSAIILALLFILSSSIYAQTQVADSLINRLNTQKLTPEEQLDLYKKICTNLSDIDVKKCDVYAEKGLALAKKENDKEKMVIFYSYLGMSYSRMNNHDEALVYLEKALALALHTKNETLIANTYTNIAGIYMPQYKHEESLKQYMKALQIYEKTGNQKGCMIVLEYIAKIHSMLRNYDRSIYYLEQSKAIAEELNDPKILSRIFYQLGVIYCSNEMYDKALEVTLKAVGIRHANNYTVLEAYAMYLVANIYVDGFQDYNKAEKYVNEALLLAEKYDIVDVFMNLKLILAKIYLNQERYQECDAIASMIYEMDSVNIERGMNTVPMIIRANIFLGNEAKAASFLSKHAAFVKQSNNKSLHQSLSEMEVKYESEKKDMRITKMEKEKALYIWIGIAGGALLLSLLVLSFFLQRLAVNKRKLAEQQVKQLEQEQQIIATQSVIDGETAERKRLARDLHDSLGGMLSIVKLNLDDVDHLQDAREMLDKSINELRRVAHHLMPKSLLCCGLKTALEDFCKAIPNAQFDYYGDGSRLDDRIEMLIYRSALELVNNAIKYAKASTIFIQLVQDSDRISLKVEDNGCGFDTETVVAGMGLENLRTRVAVGNGKINIHSLPGIGTEAYVELKIKNYE
jgi:signal transduction histidine kinase